MTTKRGILVMEDGEMIPANVTDNRTEEDSGIRASEGSGIRSRGPSRAYDQGWENIFGGEKGSKSSN